MILVEFNSVVIDYRKLMVKLLKEIVENDYCRIIIDLDGNLQGETVSGFILEHSIDIPIPGLEDEYREKFKIPAEIPYQKLELGWINDIMINYDKSMFDENEMNKISDELYDILGDKFDLMTIECNPIKLKRESF
jgi:hypothetical protein